MNTWQRLIPILMLLILAGCEEPAVPAQQASPATTEQTQTTVEPITPPTASDVTSDVTSDATADANEITGKVVGIIDGDTIDILTADKTTIRIRLNGIDAPDTGQPFGKNAKQFLSEFCWRENRQSRDARRGPIRTDDWRRVLER